MNAVSTHTEIWYLRLLDNSNVTKGANNEDTYYIKAAENNILAL